MPPRKMIDHLPKALRDDLDARIIDGAFSGYAALSQWLADNGHEISRSSIQRHGSQLERRIEGLRIATEQAEALVAASPDDKSAMADGALRLVQKRMFNLMVASEEGDMTELARAARALSETSRASLALRRDRRAINAQNAAAAEKAARAQGVAAPAIAVIRAAIEGTGHKAGEGADD